MALENHAVSHLWAGRIYPAFIGVAAGRLCRTAATKAARETAEFYSQAAGALGMEYQRHDA
jgi:hypothetical protein